MALKVCLILGLMTVSLSQPIHHEPPKHYKKEPRPYAYSYGVKNDYTGTVFGQKEESDGKNVLGSYSVQLPDGRKQTVKYKADHYNGFIADVSYYGEAKYPSKVAHPPFTVKPQHDYHPQNDYHPKPHHDPHPEPHHEYHPEPPKHIKKPPIYLPHPILHKPKH